MNALSNFNETSTSSEYSLAPTDHFIRFGRSKVKVTAGHRGGEVIHVDDSQSLSSLVDLQMVY